MKSLRRTAAYVVAILSAGAVQTQVPLDDVLPLLRSERWQDATLALTPIVEQNPYDGLAHYYLAACLLRIERYEEAGPLYQRAIELGVNGRRAFVRGALLGLARCQIQVGTPEAALGSVREAWSRWGFSDLASLREDLAFASFTDDPWFALHSGPIARADRLARWHADIAVFRETLLAVHPAPFRFIDAASWNRQSAELEANVAALSDLEIVAGLMRLAALIGDGHTSVYPPTSGDGAWHLLPIFPLWLADGWFIVAAAPPYAELVGAQILGAGDVAIEEIYATVVEHLPADNAMTPRWLAGVALQFAESYVLANAAESESVHLQLKLADGTQRQHEVRSGPLDRDPNAGFAPADWPTMFARAPLWLERSDQPFWHRALSDSGLVYSQVNAVADGKSQTLAAYGHELREFVQRTAAKGLILDLRKNNGGNAEIGRDLVEEILRIPGIEERGRLFLLIGPRSYSATGYLIGFLERHCAPILVGLPSGVRPVNYSSERSFTLPNSGVTGSISYELRVEGETSEDRRPWFAPDLVVWPTSTDLRAGRDPLIEATLGRVSAGK
jgi:tetratricopeptide (TPR) repeat protein